MRAPSSDRRLAITIRGVVQGVGFRPFVYRAAVAERLNGWVVNDSRAVRIEVQGSVEAVDRFVDTLRRRCPAQARIDHLAQQELTPREIETRRPASFEIRQSVAGTAPRPAIPPDLATCDDCLAEVRGPAQRRYRYPFTNCTSCGPRWSIIQSLPYDRSRTSMRGFPMCDACRREYENPSDRRFHAQPIACPHCGPQLQLLSPSGHELAGGEQALGEAVQAIQSGQIVAIKGLGGFQLVADASDQQAVARLRRRKHRPHKPLAVMLSGNLMVRDYCQASALQMQTLASPAAPILLIERRERPKGQALADNVAPGNPYLGVMLPYTPLHHLLLADTGRPLICTSGNRSEEPMAITTADALRRLGDIADQILTHNRPIVRPVDDSVAWLPALLDPAATDHPPETTDDTPLSGASGASSHPVVASRSEVSRAGRPMQILRRARGFAPLPIRVNRPLPCVLAFGGHLKNTVALSVGEEVIVSPHVGDLDNTLSTAVHRRAVTDLVEFFRASPVAVACDLHPDYNSTRHAEQWSVDSGLPLYRVQHHHAHVLSAMAEHGVDGPVLGFAWDGTGYGTDRTVWGGEALLCEGSDFERVAHLRPFSLPGGDRAAREPRRSALGLLFEMYGIAGAAHVQDWFRPAEMSLLLAALDRPGLFPRCSSMGRLFDAVAALCGLPSEVTFEGQAAMALEFLADRGQTSAYTLAFRDTHPVVVDWQPLIDSLLADRVAGVPPAIISGRFHNALAASILEVAQRVKCAQVVLTGGCFQNRLLADRAVSCLSKAGFEVYTQQAVPPGDGGIALGQVLGAALQVGE